MRDVHSTVNNGQSLVGTNATFNCPPGMILTGPSATVCMENGEWEPDPSEAMCKGEKSDISTIINKQ